MKNPTLVKYLLVLIFVSFAFNMLRAQSPANDQACRATSLLLDVPPDFMSNKRAGFTPQEYALLGAGGWLSTSPRAINNSLWYSFTAPVSGAVEVNLSGSDFDTELAVFSVGDCSDYSTFHLIGINDDQPTRGMNLLSDRSSMLQLDGLVPGEVYYVLVDGKMNEMSGVPATGTVSIFLTELLPGLTQQGSRK